MDDDSLDRLLREYLDQEARSNWRGEMSTRIERLVNQALATDHKIEAGFARVEGELRLIKAEQSYLAQRVEALEDAEEVTGVERIDALRAKLDSERARSRGVSRLLLGIVAALVVALLTAGTALAVKALAWGATKAERTGAQ